MDVPPCGPHASWPIGPVGGAAGSACRIAARRCRGSRQSQSPLRASAIELRLKLPIDVPAMSQVEIPGTGVSLTTVVELVRDAFNRPSPRVQGEIVLPMTSGGAAGTAEMTVRIATSNAYRVLPVISADAPGTLARCAA